MQCLAFDLGTKMGWAAGDLRGSPDFGHEILGDAGSKHGARFTQALIVANRLIRRHEPELICLEAIIPAGSVGAQERSQMAMGLRAMIHVACFRTGCKAPEEYHVGTIRKHFIGKGNVGGQRAKSMTIEQCMDLGWDVTTDDEADACAVWAYAGEKHKLRRNKVYGGLF